LFVDATLHHLAMEMLKQEAGIKQRMFRTGVKDRLASPYWRATWPECSAVDRCFQWSKSGQLRGLSDRAA
jgi:hypothetical protein